MFVVLSNINKNLLTALLIMLLLNRYVLKMATIDIVIGIVAFAILIYANRHVLKTLSFLEITGVLVFVAAVIALLVGFFHLVASPLDQLLTVGWINYLVKVAVVIAVLIPALGLLYKGMRLITKGKFPVMDIEPAQEKGAPTQYPINSQVQQLVDEDQIVKAVKLARELYGYSLLEAKKYVDRLK